MGGVISTVYTPEDFFRRFETYDCQVVEVTLLGGYTAGKKYSSLIPNTAGIIEYTVVVPAPEGFTLEGFAHEKAIFKQNPGWGWLFLALLILFLIWGYLFFGTKTDHR